MTYQDRLDRYKEEWLWHAATDELEAGHGIHMRQLLFRLPRDGQTEDMKFSIECLIEDLETALRKLEMIEEIVRPVRDDPEICETCGREATTVTTLEGETQKFCLWKCEDARQNYESIPGEERGT